MIHTIKVSDEQLAGFMVGLFMLNATPEQASAFMHLLGLYEAYTHDVNKMSMLIDKVEKETRARLGEFDERQDYTN